MSFVSPKHAVALAGVAALLALGVAFASEWYGGLVPCSLCLVDRWPYRIAIGVSVIGLLLPVRLARWVLVLLLLIGLASVAAAVVHVGVERHFWPSPLPKCVAPHITGTSIAERLAQMPALPSKSCEIADYPVEIIPVSFAELSLIYALAVCGLLTMFLMRTSRSDR